MSLLSLFFFFFGQQKIKGLTSDSWKNSFIFLRNINHIIRYIKADIGNAQYVITYFDFFLLQN